MSQQNIFKGFASVSFLITPAPPSPSPEPQQTKQLRQLSLPDACHLLCSEISPFSQNIKVFFSTKIAPLPWGSLLPAVKLRTSSLPFT